MSNLVDHAKRELALAGEDPAAVKELVRMVQAFARMGHSGGSAMFAAMTVDRLLHYKPLTPLTNDPYEWQYHTQEVWGSWPGVWQNKRDPEAFSADGGQTYWLLYETTKKWWKRKPHKKYYRSVLAVPFSGSIPVD